MPKAWGAGIEGKQEGSGWGEDGNLEGGEGNWKGVNIQESLRLSPSLVQLP